MPEYVPPRPDDQPLSAAFCPHCGYPTAKPRYNIETATIVVEQGAPTSFRVSIANTGHGNLYYVMDIANGLRCAPDKAPQGSIAADETLTVSWTAAPDSIGSDVSSVLLYIRTLSRGPNQTGRNRREPISELWETNEVRFDVLHRTRGPVEIDADCVMVGFNLATNEFHILNHGQLSLPCRISCHDGFEVQCGGQMYANEQRLVLDGGRPGQPNRCTVLVRRKQDTDRTDGVVLVEPEGLPPTPVQVQFVDPSSRPDAERRYTVGVDFGTSKTAVAWVDNYVDPPVPEILRWDRKDSKDDQWLPSAVFYPTEGRPLFGGRALAAVGRSDVTTRALDNYRVQTDRGTLYVGVKMLLRQSGDPDSEEREPWVVASDFLGYVFSRLQGEPRIDLRDATVVLTLPVLEDDEQYDLQLTSTRKAAEAAAAKAGVGADQIRYEKEPVCAAVDLVRNQTDSASQLRQDDVIVVLDCGAGTTDVSAIRVAERDGQYSFARVESDGWPWGGDNIDLRLYEIMLSQWYDPDMRGEYNKKPKHIMPVDLQQATKASGQGSDPSDWSEVLRASNHLKFTGATRSVAKPELLAQVTGFKERHLSEVSSTSLDELTLATPLVDLDIGAQGVGLQSIKMRTDVILSLLGREFQTLGRRSIAELEHAIEHRVELLEVPASSRRSLCAVGGSTLLRGWRDAVDQIGIAHTSVIALAPELRRFHVARGAAQLPLLKVEGALPDDLRLLVQAIDWPDTAAGTDADVIAECSIERGTPPSERSRATTNRVVTLSDRQALCFSVLLGSTVLRRSALNLKSVRQHIGATLDQRPSVRLQASIAYTPSPPSISLEVQCLLPGYPLAVNVPAARLPAFEV